ncbi:MAG: hypothetical protein HQL20_10900 [Candidatus Omnitrophica bacterium]|nr:hypothetical protein [Candidatus Omnitrophota bacterium]
MLNIVHFQNLFHIVHIALLTTFIGVSVLPGPAIAQAILSLPAPGATVLPSSQARPLLLKGLKFTPQDPFHLDFLLDKGTQSQEPNTGGDTPLRESSEQLIKYFLAALTVPQKDLWVNLSPYEHERITPSSFGSTAMSRDLLAQDYLLKQLTASLLGPDRATGQAFWARVYKAANAKFGTSDIPIDTFHKVWIIPGRARVYTKGNTVVILESHLKVMLETDYLALANNASPDEPGSPTLPAKDLTKQILREIIIPVIEQEINEGLNFATLRQAFHAMILAKWFKDHLRESLLGASYVDRSKTTGIKQDNMADNEAIYQQYVEAYRKGVVNIIREEADPATGEVVPRKYFSGGIDASELTVIEDHSGSAGILGTMDAFQASCDLKPADQVPDAAAKDQHLARNEILSPADLNYMQTLKSKIQELITKISGAFYSSELTDIEQLGIPWLRANEASLLAFLEDQGTNTSISSLIALKKNLSQEDFEYFWPGIARITKARGWNIQGFINVDPQNITRFMNTTSFYPNCSLLVLLAIFDMGPNGKDRDLWEHIIDIIMRHPAKESLLFVIPELHRVYHNHPDNYVDIARTLLSAQSQLKEDYHDLIHRVMSARADFYPPLIRIATALKQHHVFPNTASKSDALQKIINTFFRLNSGLETPLDDPDAFFTDILTGWAQRAKEMPLTEFQAAIDKEVEDVSVW